MRAMVLSAGLGTRLRPLTLVRPKVLTPVAGTRVLDFWIQRLHSAGCESVIVNAHHLPDQLVEAVRKGPWAIRVDVRVEPVLLGTGGGIRNAIDFFEEEPFLVINGDIICDVPIAELQRQYLDSGAPVGLLMHDCPEFNNVAVDCEGHILAFGQEAVRLIKEDPGLQFFAFTGIHIINPEVFDGVPGGRPGDILSIYRNLIAAGNPPVALHVPSIFWRETGSIDSYRELHKELGGVEEDLIPPLHTGTRYWIHPEADVSHSSLLRGYVSIGSRSFVGEGVELEDSILWERAVVLPGSRLRNCIVADGVVVAGIHDNEILHGPVR